LGSTEHRAASSKQRPTNNKRQAARSYLLLDPTELRMAFPHQRLQRARLHTIFVRQARGVKPVNVTTSNLSGKVPESLREGSSNLKQNTDCVWCYVPPSAAPAFE
jgi:hypothetical protein